MIEVKNLRKIYHTKQKQILAVDNFSFCFNNNEFVSLVGPSGCGKSTILSILCGLEKKSTGSIYVNKNIKFGYMLQSDSLLPWRNILNNCLIGLEIKGKVTENDRQYVINLLKTYGLKDFIYDYPNNLSGGMKQRVALIRTLAVKPDILLLDEPFSALDAQSRLSVSDDVYKIIKKEKKCVIMVTHDIGEAISFSDKVIVLSKRPCKIKKVYNISFANNSSPIYNRQTNEFNKYYSSIWKDIDCHE